MGSDSVIRAHQAAGAYRKVEFETFDRFAVAGAVFAEAAVPAAPETPAPAPDPAPEVVDTPAAAPDAEAPFEIAPGVRLPTAEDVEAIHQQAWKDGYDAGYEEGSARGRLEAAELHQLLTQFDQTLSGLDQAVGDEILALALEVARLVVRDTIAQRPESVLAVVREALAQTPQQHAQLHLNPADAALVRQYLGDTIGHAGHRIVEDEAIERGGCRIDAAGSQLDATVATRWRRVTENLSRAHPWHDEHREE